MPSWNAYKVFASGKRAKMPYTTFDSEDSKHFHRKFFLLLTVSKLLLLVNQVDHVRA